MDSSLCTSASQTHKGIWGNCDVGKTMEREQGGHGLYFEHHVLFNHLCYSPLLSGTDIICSWYLILKEIWFTRKDTSRVDQIILYHIHTKGRTYAGAHCLTYSENLNLWCICESTLIVLAFKMFLFCMTLYIFCCLRPSLGHGWDHWLVWLLTPAAALSLSPKVYYCFWL